jgi:LysM repeat protein
MFQAILIFATTLFQVEVQPGETLASLSLKYNVPLAELKRVNNLISGNEFFALKRIKIPVKPDSLLTEILPGTSAAVPGQTRENGWIIKRASTPDTTGTGCTSSSVPSSPNSEAEGLGDVDEVSMLQTSILCH